MPLLEVLTINAFYRVMQDRELTMSSGSSGCSVTLPDPSLAMCCFKSFIFIRDHEFARLCETSAECNIFIAD